jgi:ParB-like chromosome segregation protein Spo0J
VADGKWNAHWPIDIDVVEVDDAQARELALAANVVRAELSPADEAVGFYRLKLSGESEEQIATRFAVPLRRVQRRLAIGGLPQEIITALRTREITLDCAKAFTLSPSAERQSQLFAELSQDRSRGVTTQYVRLALVENYVRGGDGMAEFVGEEAYEEAGGVITRDLFSEAAWFEDGALLKRLYDEKFEALVRSLKDEGWSFVEVAKSRNWSLLEQKPGGKRTLTDEEKAELERLGVESETLAKSLEAMEDRDDVSWETRDAAQDKLEAIVARIDELEEKPFTAKQKAKCGVQIVVQGDHSVSVYKGLQRPQKPEAEAAPKGGDDASPAAMQEPAKPATPDWSESLRQTLAAAASDATKLAMAQVKPALAARMGLAARIMDAVNRSYDAPFESWHISLRGGALFGPYARDLLAEFREGDFAEIVARLETKTPEQIMQIEACLAAAVFKCSSLSNSDVRAVIEMIDPDMRGEGFVIGADFLGKLKRDQLDLVMAECGGEPAAKTAKKVEVVEAVAAIVTTTGWLPFELRTPSYEGPGSNAWAEKISEAAAVAAAPEATPEAA